MTSNHVSVVQSDSVVVSLERASTALAEAKTIQQTKRILDVAAAAEIYARRQKLGDEIEAQAASIKVEAMRKLGEFMKATPKNKGAKGSVVTGSKREPVKDDAPTLAELGLTKKESAVAQKLASLPEKEFEQVRDGHTTIAKAIAAVTEQKKAKPASKPKPEPAKTAAQVEADQLGVEAFGDSDVLADMQKQIETLTCEIKAAEADDSKAEALKWRRAYDSAVRGQSEAMDRVLVEQKLHAFKHRQLMRCGKSVGETDPDKIAPAVEAFVRAHMKVAA